MLLSDLPHWFVIITAVSVGLCFGSFLNVVIYRLPRGLNLAHPPSACPGCQKPIAGYDNVPVLAWLWLRGKARCCGTPISPRYPLIEALGGLLAWAVVETRVYPSADDWGVGFSVAVFATYLALGLVLIALAFIDLEFMILPDSLTLGGAALGVVAQLYLQPLEGNAPWMRLGESLFWAALGFVIVWLPFIWGYRLLRGQPGMGLGDAKLLVLAGAWFSGFGVFFALFAGAIQGTVAALVLFAAHGKIEEPAQVTREREELRALIEGSEGDERAALEQGLRDDPLGKEAAEGLAEAKIAFGPFLALALLELLILEAPLHDAFTIWLSGASQ